MRRAELRDRTTTRRPADEDRRVPPGLRRQPFTATAAYDGDGRVVYETSLDSAGTGSFKSLYTLRAAALGGEPLAATDSNGKEVKVRATYHVGFEYSYFDDPSCKEYAVETTPYWIGNVV